MERREPTLSAETKFAIRAVVIGIIVFLIACFCMWAFVMGSIATA